MKIGIIVLPKFDINKAIGGAENICRLVTIGLTQISNVMVFHSEDNPQKILGNICNHTEKLSSINAFYLDEWTKNRGEISPSFCSNAWNELVECDFLISFERVLRNSPIPQMAVLGGISYTHCVDIAMSAHWTWLIVPSPFIKNKCVALGADGNKIHIIPNGIDGSKFFKLGKDRTFKVLLPFRPDMGKGFIESIDFVQKINSLGRWGEYKILITRQFNCSFAEKDFYQTIEKYASKKQVVIEYINWGDQNTMNYIYNQCDFVSSLGTLEEGFGLTTIESVLSGHPVLAKRIGATKDILPPNTGIIFYDENPNTEDVIEKLVNMSDKEISEGGAYIKTNYEIKIMQANYLELAQQFWKLERKND